MKPVSTSAHFIYRFDPRFQRWSVRFGDYELCKTSEENPWYAESPEEALRKIEKVIQSLQRETMDSLAWQREELCRIAEQMRAVCTNPKYLSAGETLARAQYDCKNTPDEERLEVPWECRITHGKDGTITTVIRKG